LCAGSGVENADHPLQALENVWRTLHYPPETTSISLVYKLLAMIQQVTF